MTRLHRGTRLARLAGVVALVGASAALALPTRASAHTGTPTPALSSAASTSVSKTKVVDRVVFDSAGNPTTLDQHTVKLTVSRTTDLRSLQLIHVSWSGAAPTGGIVGDQNSDLAQNEEHSFVLLQCRGVDDSTAPAAQQLSPDTCWTGFADERFQYGYSTYPAWQSDGYATPEQRAPVVNAPSLVPPLKFLIRRLKLTEARELAAFALDCESASEILARCQELAHQIAPGLFDIK